MYFYPGFFEPGHMSITSAEDFRDDGDLVDAESVTQKILRAGHPLIRARGSEAAIDRRSLTYTQ